MEKVLIVWPWKHHTEQPKNGGNRILHLEEVEELFLQFPMNPRLAEQLLEERDLKLQVIRSAKTEALQSIIP